MGGEAVRSCDRCDEPAVIQYPRDCVGCEDVAADHRAVEVESTALFTDAVERHKVAEQARDEAAAAGDNIAFVAAVGQANAALEVIAEHGHKAVRAAIRAAEHEAPHTHPVFACAKHEKAGK